MPAPSETFRLALSVSAPYAPAADLVPVDPTRRPSHPGSPASGKAPAVRAGTGRTAEAGAHRNG
ncbi:hypothetical protein Scel_80240 [Streptomyces cellostaticus]|nr:hypothetical protein Scel_80240 [Streptomyces cellostaticus]